MRCQRTHPRCDNRRCLLKVFPTNPGSFEASSRACRTISTTLLVSYIPSPAPQSNPEATEPLLRQPNLVVACCSILHCSTQQVTQPEPQGIELHAVKAALTVRLAECAVRELWSCGPCCAPTPFGCGTAVQLSHVQQAVCHLQIVRTHTRIGWMQDAI